MSGLNTIYSNGTHKIQSVGVPWEDNRHTLKITTPSEKRIILPKDGSVEFTVKITDKFGNTLPVNDTFAVPVRRVMGAVERTVSIVFTNGVANKSISWPSSGEFEITEDLVNMYLSGDSQFKFSGINISVME